MIKKTLIEIRKVSKTFKMGMFNVKALKNINLSIVDGEFVALMGPSGSGKSTLLNLLGCLASPDEGEYVFDGILISEQDDSSLSKIRNKKIGFIFQDFYLQARKTALENVLLPIRFSRTDRKESKDYAIELLKKMGLSKRLYHLPSELSGGQQQRVAIARAIINRPRIILADEPTGNLDSSTTEGILELFRELNSQGHTLIIVTHDQNVANQANRIILLEDGQIQK